MAKGIQNMERLLCCEDAELKKTTFANQTKTQPKGKKMNILLGVTGSVAASLVPKLAIALEKQGHVVQIVGTKTSFRFWYEKDLLQRDGGQEGESFNIWNDADEFEQPIYSKGQPIRHIELRDWADLFLIAPLTANTLAKIANGLCDNLLTNIARAWDSQKPLLVTPAMNTVMWEHPITEKQLKLLESFYNFHIIQPTVKKLTCGDTGPGAMANIETILKTINSFKRNTT